MNLLIVFQSRNSLYSFAKFLKSNGMNINIINTPNSISTSCTLSIKTDFKNLNRILSMINGKKVSGMIGIYSISKNLGYERVERLY